MVRLEFKGALGSFSFEDGEFFGTIDNITDLVTFSGRNLEELIDAFKEAVIDYIQLCKEIGKTCNIFR